jgi:hypothetical protein
VIDTSKIDRMMQLEQRKESRLTNVERKKLKGPARDIYLLGLASLSKCEEVAEKGNGGKGYRVPVIVSEEHASDNKPAKKRKKGKKSGD